MYLFRLISSNSGQDIFLAVTASIVLSQKYTIKQGGHVLNLVKAFIKNLSEFRILITEPLTISFITIIFEKQIVLHANLLIYVLSIRFFCPIICGFFFRI